MDGPSAGNALPRSLLVNPTAPTQPPTSLNSNVAQEMWRGGASSGSTSTHLSPAMLPRWNKEEVDRKLEESARLLQEWKDHMDKTDTIKPDDLSKEDILKHINMKRKLHDSLGIMARIVQYQVKLRKLPDNLLAAGALQGLPTNQPPGPLATNVPAPAMPGAQGYSQNYNPSQPRPMYSNVPQGTGYLPGQPGYYPPNPASYSQSYPRPSQPGAHPGMQAQPLSVPYPGQQGGAYPQHPQQQQQHPQQQHQGGQVGQPSTGGYPMGYSNQYAAGPNGARAPSNFNPVDAAKAMQQQQLQQQQQHHMQMQHLQQVQQHQQQHAAAAKQQQPQQQQQQQQSKQQGQQGQQGQQSQQQASSSQYYNNAMMYNMPPQYAQYYANMANNKGPAQLDSSNAKANNSAKSGGNPTQYFPAQGQAPMYPPNVAPGYAQQLAMQSRPPYAPYGAPYAANQMPPNMSRPTTQSTSTTGSSPSLNPVPTSQQPTLPQATNQLPLPQFTTQPPAAPENK